MKFMGEVSEPQPLPVPICARALCPAPVLSFLESPATALDGQTPRAALEQGAMPERILALATAEAH